MASQMYEISISRNVSLYLHDQHSPSTVGPALSTSPRSGDASRLIILLPWLYATKEAVEKYCNIYRRYGLDVLVVHTNLHHFLWPAVGRAEARNLLELLASEGFRHRSRIVVHSISIGNYLYVLMLLETKTANDCLSAVGERIKGQILDSALVGDQEKILNGILVTGKYGFAMRAVITLALGAYYALTRKWTTDFYEHCYEELRTTLFRGPTLLIYSRDDTLGDVEGTERLVAGWRGRSEIDLRLCVWEKSVHAAHLMTHPEEYCQQINQFLQELQMVQTSAKL